MKKLLTLASFVVLGFSAAVYAAADKEKKTEQPASEGKLTDFSFGEVISGPAVDLTKTEGKAVVVEIWGIHCGPCLASLPHMQELAKARKNDVLFIGAHAQDGTNEEVKDVVKKNKLTYTITKGYTGGPSGQGSGIPRAYVFDASGKLIFSGHPADSGFDGAVRKAAATAKAVKAAK